MSEQLLLAFTHNSLFIHTHLVYDIGMNTRTVIHDETHTDIETLLTDADGNEVWAVTKCITGGTMARTLSGNLTGKAAQLDHTDLREYIDMKWKQDQEKKKTILSDMIAEIRDTMTQAQYDAWWQAAPEKGFFVYACDYLVQIKTTPVDQVDIVRWSEEAERDADWCQQVTELRGGL